MQFDIIIIIIIIIIITIIIIIIIKSFRYLVINKKRTNQCF